MPCETWREKLGAYMDGELPASESIAVRAHLQGCTGCAAEIADQVRMKRSVAAAGRSYAPSAAFRAKMMRAVSKKRSGGQRWLWRLVFAPVAMVVILSVGVGLYVDHLKSERQAVYGEITDLHVATLASSTPVDVVSTDRHTVKPWFEGKLPFTFNLPELQGTDFTLVGGRVTYLSQAPGAELIYQIRKHEISVFIFQERSTGTAQVSSGPISNLSFNITSWSRNGLQYFIIGDVGSEDIEGLSQLFHSAAK
jgi:anti-sigma factor RsiW